MSELLELLSIAHKLTPELRFCQLLMNIGIIKHTVEFDDKGLATPTIFDPYNYSDESVIKLIKDYIDENKDRKPTKVKKLDHQKPEESRTLVDDIDNLVKRFKNRIKYDKIDWEAIKIKPITVEATTKERIISGLLRTMYMYKEDWNNLPVYYKLYIYKDKKDLSMDFVPREYLRESDGRRGQGCYTEGMFFDDVKRQFYIDKKDK